MPEITFSELAQAIGIDLLDLIPDEEEALSLSNEYLYECPLVSDLLQSPDVQEAIAVFSFKE